MSRKHQNSIAQKLSSRKGESLAETLGSLLIAALALIILAGAITSASRLITTSRKKLDTYYDKAEEMVNQSSTGVSTSVTITDEASVISAQTIPITYYLNDEWSNMPVILY